VRVTVITCHTFPLHQAGDFGLKNSDIPVTGGGWVYFNKLVSILLHDR